MKLALVSFDGLDPRIIYDNLGSLPNFKGLIEKSMHGKWKTPGHTIPSFTATLTGRQYNVTNFHWDEGEGGYQRHRQTEMDYLWDLTDSSMTLLNIPVLYPPEDINGVMVSGMLCPDGIADKNLATPKEVQTLLNYIGYIHEVRADKVFNDLGADGMFDLLVECMEVRTKAARDLIDQYDNDLFYGVWTSTDRWFHRQHTHGVDYFPIYEKADEQLGKMLEYIPDNVPLIVFSDHGFAHFPTDNGVHTGHMYEGFYCIRSSDVPSYRDDSLSILDLFPTVLNYLDGDVPSGYQGRILFNNQEQDETVKNRLDDLGYL